MRCIWALLVILCLSVAPFAHAVECIMSRVDAGLAGMPSDCPMVMAAKAQHPTMTVADCVKAPAVMAEVKAPLPVVVPLGLIPPQVALVAPSRPAFVPQQPRPPPQWGAMPSSRRILLATARLRP